MFKVDMGDHDRLN